MEYRTIRQDGQAQEEIKKSRFICHAKRVYSEEEARDFIAAIKKEHYKATHNCSAFIVGEKSEIKRTSDDGEPSGTAGVPMLGVMENHQVTNVCFVVQAALPWQSKKLVSSKSRNRSVCASKCLTASTKTSITF